jgi:hypothetical protein
MLNLILKNLKQLTAAERQAMFGGMLGEMQNGGNQQLLHMLVISNLITCRYY